MRLAMLEMEAVEVRVAEVELEVLGVTKTGVEIESEADWLKMKLHPI